MKKLYTLLAGAFLLASLAVPQNARSFELEGGNIYGFALKTASYWGMSANSFYSFDADNPAAGTKMGSSSGMAVSPKQGLTYSGNKYVGIGGDYVRYAIILDYNGSDWTTESYKELSDLATATDLTDDNGTVYGWMSFSDSTGSWYLATLDAATGNIEKIGEASSKRLVGLTSDGAGNLYGIGNDANLYKVSKTDGSLTLIGETGFTTGNDLQSACWDSSRGCITWANYCYSNTTWSDACQFIDVNPATGKGTLRCEADNAPQLIGLYAPASYDSKAPGQVTGLTATNSGDDNIISLSFTMPVKNFGGADFSPNLRGLSYTVTLDGNVVVEAKSADKGQEVTETIETTPGTHTVAVYASQSSFGDGPDVKATLYVGEDTPTAVTDLKASAKDCVVTLTWTAPASANGGRYKAEKLAYNISRNGQEVAANVKGNTFSETINSDALVGYSYTVTTVYNEETTSCSATSNTVFVGAAFSVAPGNPYFLDFQNCETGADTGMFFVCDPSNYGYEDPTIEILSDGDNKYASVRPQNYTSNPRLFTTGLQLEAGHSYRISFRFMTDGYYGANISVELSNAPVKDCTFVKNIIAGNAWGYGSAGKFVDVTPTEFTVDESGVYFICIQNYFFNMQWAFDDIKVEDLTSAEAAEPKAVTGFKAEAQAPGSHSIDFSFVLPETDVNGNDTELTKATLTRNGELVNEWTEGLTAGATLTWTEENAPVGYHKYEVTVENAQGVSTTATAYAQSGFNYDLAVVGFEAPEKIAAGESTPVSVTVRNNGVLRAPFTEESTYSVALVQVFKDGSTQIYDLVYGNTLQSCEEVNLSFPVVAPADGSENLEFYFYISYDEDEAGENNRSGNFTIAVENTTGVESIGATGVSVSTAGGKLNVAGAKGLPVAVHTAAGVTVYSAVVADDTLVLALEPGLYIIRAGAKAVKVKL